MHTNERLENAGEDGQRQLSTFNDDAVEEPERRKHKTFNSELL